MSGNRKKVRFEFPILHQNGKEWCAVSEMGIQKLEIVAYKFDLKEKYTFAGGHRHRLYTAHDGIHLCFPAGGQTLNIEDVVPSAPAKRRHAKG